MTVIAVRAVPGASRPGLVDVRDGELRVRVCSPPVDGRANDELCRVVAAVLGLKPREVAVVSGQRSRSKLLAVPIGEQAAAALLAAVIRPESPSTR